MLILITFGYGGEVQHKVHIGTKAIRRVWNEMDRGAANPSQ